nr:divalent cation tolerance protein CutA [Allomuricauda sp.]
MVLIHICCQSASQAEEIVDFLLEEKLVLDALVSDKLLYKYSNNGKKQGFEQTLIMCTTKALLFTKINRRIKNKYPKSTPMVYAMPIVYMDQGQEKKLKNRTEKV